MPIFFQNEGTTCFANVGLQLLLANPEFLRAVSRIDVDAEEIDRYLTWYKSTARDLPPCPDELLMGRRMGAARVFQAYMRVLETHTEPTMCSVATIGELAQFIPLLVSAIRSNEQHDVLEFVDVVLDVLSIPRTPRPSPVTVEAGRSIEETVEAIKGSIVHHCGDLSTLWGLHRSTHTCNECSAVVREELIPFLWVTRVAETRVAEGVRCDKCNAVGSRTIRTIIYEPPLSVIVHVSRHNDQGLKHHDNVAFQPSVPIRGRTYRVVAVIYHEGWSFAGGHYTSAVLQPSVNRWIRNSDAHAVFWGESFKIQDHNPSMTYAALYLS